VSLQPHGSIDPVAAAEADAAALEIDWADLFDLYPEQLDFVCGSSRPIQGWVAGRGTGKSFALFGPKALLLALNNPGKRYPSGRIKLCPGAMFARTDDECEEVAGDYFEEALARFYDRTKIQLLASYNSGLKRYTLINGATVVRRSYGRADTLKRKGRSPTYAWVVLDEVMFADVDSQQAVMTLAATLRHPLINEHQIAWATSPDGARGIVAYMHNLWLRNDPKVYLTTATTYDNPHVTDEYRETLEASCTERQKRAELYGEVLRPMNTVYAEYDEKTHIIPWTWNRYLPWILMVDWGETWGWVGAAQVVTAPDYINPADGKEYAPGDWVVAKEWPMTDGNRPEQRRMIQKAINDLGVPRDACADRAVPDENDWLAELLAPDCPVHTLMKKDHYRRSWGISIVQKSLAPGDGQRPRLYFAADLNDDQDPRCGCIRAGMGAYKYERMRFEGEEFTSCNPETNTPATHSVDGVRMGLACLVYEEELHGGAMHPYVQSPEHQPRDDSDAGWKWKRAGRRRRRGR
jgi:hypothetical protein